MTQGSQSPVGGGKERWSAWSVGAGERNVGQEGEGRTQSSTGSGRDVLAQMSGSPRWGRDEPMFECEDSRFNQTRMAVGRTTAASSGGRV